MHCQPAAQIHPTRRLKPLGTWNRSPLLATTLALGMCFSQTASADPVPWLDWSPPPECPTAGDIERRVAEWLGGPFPMDTEIVVRTALGWNGERWEVAVEISFDGRSGKRQVKVRDCQEAADFVAVAVALAVDPSLAGTMDLSDAAPAVAEPEVAEAAQQPDPTHDGGASRSDSEAQTSTRNAAKADASVAHPKAASDQRPTFRPHASASAEAAVGVLPEPAVGVGVALGGDLGRLSFNLAARWFPPKSSASEQAAAPIDFSLLGGRVSAAYLFLGPEARVGPSLAVDAGAIGAKQLRSEDDGVVEPWVSVAAGALGLLVLAEYISVCAGLELELPLTRPTFVLSDESVVHRVGVGARAALGLRFSFFGQ